MIRTQINRKVSHNKTYITYVKPHSTKTQPEILIQSYIHKFKVEIELTALPLSKQAIPHLLSPFLTFLDDRSICRFLQL